MNKPTTNNCLLCGYTYLEKVFTCTDSFVSGEQFDVYRCRSCGFMFTLNFPLGDDINRYYSSTEYISHSDSQKGLINRIYHHMRQHMLKKKTQLVIKESHRKQGRLLDVGTGTGYFPAAMQKKGWEVYALEKNEEARLYGQTKFKLDVRGEQSLYQYEPGTFDVITLWHVMEHLEDLPRVWERFRELLTDTGILVVAVPNSTSYDAEHYGAQWAAYDVPRHLWHFSPATIQKWGAKHGFVLAARYPMPFDTFYISMLSEKNKGNKAAFVKGMAIGTWLWLKTLAKKDKSSSLVYVFRKKRDGK